jgi:hypothetical protein
MYVLILLIIVGCIALLILEPTPLMRRDVLQHVPILGGYWAKKLEDAARMD